MADTRLAVQRQSWRNNEWANETDGHLRARLEIARFRDALRATFSDARYVVSDIAQWAGSGTAVGFAFVLRDTTFGHEYLFGWFARSTAGSAWMHQAWGNNSSVTMGGYFKAYSTSLASDPSTPSCFHCIAYNHDTSSSYAFGFNHGSLPLRYAAGDFQTPASSPYSALASFMPASRLVGVELQSWVATSYNAGHILYDPDYGVLRYDHGYGGNRGAYGFAWIAGNIFRLNADGGLASATDTHTRGVIFEPRASPGASSMNSALSTYPVVVQFFREAGAIENAGYLTNVLSGYTRSNYRVAGEPDYRKLRVEVASYIKGFLDPRIICEAYPFNDPAFKYRPLQLPGETEKPNLKVHSNFATMWKHNYPFYEHLPDDLAWTG